MNLDKPYIGLKTCFIIMMSIVTYSLVGQSLDLTQVEHRLSKIEDEASLCDSTIVYARQLFMQRDREGAQAILARAIEIAEEKGLQNKLVPLYMGFGRCEEMIGTLDLAIDATRQAIGLLSDESESFRGKLYNYIGRYFQKQDELDSMLHYYTMAEVWNKEHDPYRNWILYEQWHHKYVELGDLQKAESLLMKSYAITKPKGIRMDHGMLLYRMRSLASRKGDMAELAKYTKEYYDLTVVDGGSTKLIHGLELEEDLTDSERISRYESLIKENILLDFEFPNEEIYPRIARLYLNVGKPERAIHYLNRIDTTGDRSLTFISDFHKTQSVAYEALGKSSMALAALKKKVETDEKKRQELRNAELIKMETKYKMKQKEDAIALLETRDQLTTFQLSRAKKEKLFFGWLSVFLLGLLSALAYLFVQNRKRKNELEGKNVIIKKALEDKDTLLREIHHRVKNNLQVISSLLNLQSNYISDDNALKAINEGKNRVTSMALIHQNLYQQEDLTAINSRVYFEDLIESIFDSYNIGESELELTKDVSDLNIDVETMVPLGLIVNELVSNALKHAFASNQKDGKINFVLKEVNGNLIMRISDNGKGFEAKDFYASNSFGNKLIQAFKNKLEADIDIENKGGSNITLTIKKYKTVA